MLLALRVESPSRLRVQMNVYSCQTVAGPRSPESRANSQRHSGKPAEAPSLTVCHRPPGAPGMESVLGPLPAGRKEETGGLRGPDRFLLTSRSDCAHGKTQPGGIDC